MAIPDEDVAQVRAATDIVALIGEYTPLKRVGRRFTGLCPFHSEKTPSFSVNQEFDITSTDSSVSQVILTLDSALVGFVRSKHKGSACVQVASVTVAPGTVPETWKASSGSSTHRCGDLGQGNDVEGAQIEPSHSRR